VPAAEVSAKLVMQLRASTGLPMMKCKEALEATGGDLEKAVDHLRKQGLETAAKKADRTMKEGRVAIKTTPDGRSAAMVLVGCETEPVSQTPDMLGLVDDLADAALSSGVDSADVPLDSLLSLPLQSRGETADLVIKHLVARIGENIALRRAARFHTRDGRLTTYVHFNSKLGVLVELGGPAEALGSAGIDAFATDLRLHIASNKPIALSKDEVPKALVEKELEIYRDQAKQDPKTAGKPPQVVEKIVAGRLERFFGERCLLAQPWVKDDKQSVAQALEAASPKGAAVSIRRFALFQVGA
jgi:elongation factor Ts